MTDVNISQLTMFSQFLETRVMESDNCSEFKKGYREAISDLIGLSKCNVEDQIHSHLQNLSFEEEIKNER